MVAQVPQHHLRFKFKTEDALGRALYKHQINDPGSTRCFLTNVHLEENDVVLDIGANIGWYSLLFDKYSPSSVSIYAFEPDPLNYGLLAINAERNNARKITCIPKALSDKSETKTLYLYPNKNRGRHSLLPLNKGEKIQVATTTIDEFVKESQIDPRRVKFIKMDVEGYEYFVLQGADTVLPHLPLLHTEYSLSYLQKGGIDPKQFIDLIVGYQFNPYVIDAQGGLRQMPHEQLIALPQAVDILWVKEGYSLPTAV